MSKYVAMDFCLSGTSVKFSWKFVYFKKKNQLFYFNKVVESKDTIRLVKFAAIILYQTGINLSVFDINLFI